jgi:hypothetical protein
MAISVYELDVGCINLLCSFISEKIKGLMMKGRGVCVCVRARACACVRACGCVCVRPSACFTFDNHSMTVREIWKYVLTLKDFKYIRSWLDIHPYFT